MARIITAFVFFAFCIALSMQSPFIKCSEGKPPNNLRISGCDKFPCPLFKGTNLTAEWDFTVVSESKQLKPQVKAKISNAIVDYPLPQKNACKSLTNAECPLDEGEEVTYSLTMPIHKYYPPILLNIQFALLNEKDEIQVCFSVDAKVLMPHRDFNNILRL